MDRPELHKRLDAILDEFARAGLWGSIEIELRGGDPCYIARRMTEKISNSKEAIAHEYNRRK